MKIFYGSILFFLALTAHATNKSRQESICYFPGDRNPNAIGLSECDHSDDGKNEESIMSNRLANILCTGAHCSSSDSDAVRSLTAQINPKSYGSLNDTGGSNLGLRKYFQAQTQNHSCFGELIFRFYQNKAFLQDAGTNLNTPSQQGKTWALALKTAGGNANLAMDLIGACGHDDDVSATSQSFLTFCGEQSHLLKVIKDEAGNCSSDDHPQKTYSAVQFRCPTKGTLFFSPEGLPGTSVSPSIKSELAKDYAPDLLENQALENIPHKSYHVYGSAYLACHLIQEGLDKEKALAIERETSIIYRAVRVCTAAQKNTENFNVLLQKINQPTIDFSSSPHEVVRQWNTSAQAVEKFLNQELDAKRTDIFGTIGLGMVDPTPENIQMLRTKVKSYSGIVLAGFLTSSDHESSNAEEQISRLQPDFGDNAKEFSETFKKLRSQANSTLIKIGGFIGGKTISTKIKSITDTLPCISNAAINFATRHDYQCGNLVGCDAAKLKLRTYKADFTESSVYHQLGAQFAAQHCSPVHDINEVLDQSACSALAHLNTESAKAPSGTKSSSGSATH
jgi:hypothetical protein